MEAFPNHRAHADPPPPPSDPGARRHGRKFITCPAASLAVPVGSNLAVLLQALKAEPLGLYDGVRFVRIDTQDGSRITVTINCEQQRWRVARLEPRDGRTDCRDNPFDPFESAPGIGRSTA
jgi:hypothetical protein